MAAFVAKARSFTARAVLLGAACCIPGCGGADGSISEFPQAGQQLRDSEAELVASETCAEDWPEANTLDDAERVADLAERCRRDAKGTELKVAAALEAVIEGGDGAAGAAGAASGNAEAIAEATNELRAAREHTAKATRGANLAEQRLERIRLRLNEARLWRLGFGVQAHAAAAAGDRSLTGLGGALLLRPLSVWEVQVGASRDRVGGLVEEDGLARWTTARVTNLIGRGEFALALGVGSALTVPSDDLRPVITQIGLHVRPHGAWLGCHPVAYVADLKLFAEHWYLAESRIRTDPPDPPVFFGVSATLGLGFLRKGPTPMLKLDGKTGDCR